MSSYCFNVKTNMTTGTKCS